MLPDVGAYEQLVLPAGDERGEARIDRMAIATALAQQATTTAPEGNATVPERGEENASMQTTRTEAPTAPSGLMPQELPRDELPATDMPSSDLPASDQ